MISRRRRQTVIALPLCLGSVTAIGAPPSATAVVAPPLRVGPFERFRTIRQAIEAAQPGDTIEIAAGDYRGDVAVLAKDLVHLVGVGGRPRLIADGASAEGKGTLVVRGLGVVVENLEFVSSRVDDHYGNGIRLDGGSLLVKNCRFTDNEIGLMTANDPSIVLEVSGCEFSGLVQNTGRGRALAHSLYAGTIESLRVEGSYFHDGSIGHLIKSRARTNVIRYNRLTDERGIASYELEFPDGGLAEVVGNLIHQGRRSENGTVISFGAEGLRWPDNRLEVLFNTIVSDLATDAVFIAVRQPSVVATVRYNVLLGRGAMDVGPSSDVRFNVRGAPSDFADPGAFDFRPRIGAAWVGSASGAGRALDKRLVPTMQYKHPASVQELPKTRIGILSPGAFQLPAR